jgi:hypothetical protein
LTFFLSRSESFGPELAGTPDHFILYGGTAIALRLGHRQSVDFDFFSPVTFEPHSLLKTVPYLKEATVRKSAPNDLAVTVDRGGPVQLSLASSSATLTWDRWPSLNSPRAPGSRSLR